MKKIKKQERTWKNFKLDEKKVYEFIGRVTVTIIALLSMSSMMVWGFLQNTIY